MEPGKVVMKRFIVCYIGIVALIFVCALACGNNPFEAKEPEWECTTTYTITPLNDENRILLTRSATAIAATRFSAEWQSGMQALAKLCDSLEFTTESERDRCDGGLSLATALRYTIPGVDYNGFTRHFKKQDCTTR